MNFADGFTLLRPLGYAGDGQLLGFDALVAIHFVHRAFAVVVTVVLLALAWRLWRAGQRHFGGGLAGLLLLQLLSGLSNVVLGWPLVAALAHTAGAAALVLLLTLLLARSARHPQLAPAPARLAAAGT